MDLQEIDKLTEKVIGCAMKVSNVLGAGFLEKVYENALALELRRAGFKVDQQKTIPVLYSGVIVGDYLADLVVEGSLILELKAAKVIDTTHEAQMINYLRATKLKVGLIVNFGTSKIGIRRIIN